MSKGIFVPVLAAAFLAGMPAHAQDQYRDRDGGWQQQGDSERAQDRHDAERWQDRHDNERWQERRDDERRREERRAERSEGGWGHTEDFNAGYDGAGPYHNLRRGEPLPSRYRTHQYVVDRWWAHHLPRPPHGYKWVQTGADYVMVGESSGIIARVVIGR